MPDPKWIDEIVLEVREDRAPWSPGRLDAARRAAAREAAEHKRYPLVAAEIGQPTIAPLREAARDLLDCEIPGQGGASVCEDCLTRLERLLRGVPLVVTELNVTRVATRGSALMAAKLDPDLKPLHPAARDPLPLVVTVGAVGARDRLRRVLWQAVEDCVAARIQNASPHAGIPHRGDVPAIAEWLHWRLDGLTRHPSLERFPAHVAASFKVALTVIDSRSASASLVKCSECTLGWIEIAPGDELATCPDCGATNEAQLVRDRMLDNLGDRLMSAGEIADLAIVHLGLQHDSPRDVLRKRINKWASVGAIASHPGPGGTRHRFGEVRTHLVAFDQRHEHSWGDWRRAAEQPDPDVVHMFRRCQFEGCDQTKRRARPAPKGGQR